MIEPIREVVGEITGYAPACVESDGSKPPGGLLAAVAVVVLVVASASVPVAAAPAGMVGVPDANIQEDVPAGETVGVNASDLHGSVMASRHASTLEVVVTTQERASAYLEADGTRVGTGSDGLALVLRDETNDEGRKVSLPAGVVKETLGYLPETVYGRHDDGTRWRRNVEAGGGLLTFDVPHFSNNTVTFSGQVSISATPAQDGSTYSYSVESLDAVDNFSVQFTGTSTTETDTFTVPKDGSSSSTIAGSSIPSSATVDVSWSADPSALKVFGNSKTGDFFQIDSANTPQSGTISGVPSDPETIELEVGTYADYNYGSGDYIRLKTGSGTTIKEWNPKNVNGVITADASDIEGVGSVYWEVSTSHSVNLYYIEVFGDNPDSVDVTVDGTTKTWTSQGRKTISLDGDTSISASSSVAGGGSVTTQISYTETSYSPNPSIIVNGVTTSHAETLAPGETATVYPPKSSVNTSNTVKIQLGESSDAPSPSVDMEYVHEAEDEVSVAYKSETWSERYNVTRYYTSETDSASVTVPFKSDVLAVRDVKYRIDGSTWVTVNDYSLQNTTLTAEIGHVSAGSTVTVVANGSRVDVQDGSIQVTNPTTAGDTLATEFRVESAGSEFAIDVSGTEESQYLHYLTNESWTAPAEYSVVEADGQVLYVPNVSSGATAIARSYAMEVHPQNDVRVRLVEAGDTPEFDVGPATVKGDEVEFVLYGAASGEEYKLESLEDGKIWDKGTANSPVRLTMEDTHDSLIISIVEALSGGDGGGSGGGGVAPLVSTGAGNPLVPPYIMLGLGAGVLLLGGVVVSRAGVPVWVYAPVAALVGLVTVETLAPGAVSYTFADVGTLIGARVAGVVGQVSAPLLLAGGGLVLWGAYRVISRLTRKQNVTLRLRRGR